MYKNSLTIEDLVWLVHPEPFIMVHTEPFAVENQYHWTLEVVSKEQVFLFNPEQVSQNKEPVSQVLHRTGFMGQSWVYAKPVFH